MDDDADFTFCQVAAPAGEEMNKLVPDIDGIKIGDESPSESGGKRDSGTISEDGAQDNPASTRQATVGSLSFNVTDRSTPKKASDSALGDAGSSLKRQELNAGGKKPAARAKVPFEKGYSQMDWLKLTRTHPDLAGLKGQSNRRLISMNEVKQHRMEGSMWTVLKGRVYNLSPYLKFHPGGVDILMKAAGKDCTSLFNKYHAWVNAEFLLEKCLVGILEENQ